MSLFGSSPDESHAPALSSKSQNSLFDDEPSPAPGSKSSLFADDDDTSGSPWGLPTPKKAARGDLIKNLLPASDVPDVYIDLYDNLVKGEDGIGGKISIAGVAKVLSAGNVGADEQSRITSIISLGGQLQPLGRNEFNVFLALVGLAQEHEDITLDSVDERRKNLPEPKLPGISSSTATVSGVDQMAAKPPQRPSTPPTAPESISPQTTRTPRKDSLEFPESDPWGSPAMHRGHNHETPKTNGTSRTPTAINAPPHVRTTSDFTTASAEGSNGASSRPPPTTAVWGSYDGAPSGSYNAPGDRAVSGGGFGGPGGDEPPPTTSRSFGGGRVTSSGAEENIVINLLPEKEGMFMFQHHNYQVTSARRGSKVVRRYSDFVWLLDCLQKRYPFRQIPLLPPKRVGVNGNHLAADGSFIEKRKRGLTRFANALVRHPVLSQEQLVIMFLTVPTELAIWRKQATISVQEEFVGRTLPPGLEDSLSPTLNELFETSRSGIKRSADVYINLCTLIDRLSKRNEGLAADHLRVSLSLQALTDASQDTQSLLEDEARAWDEGVLEDLKRQRDALVSMRDLFDRRDRYDKDNIPYLERRIQNNEAKLVAIRAKPEEMVKPGEVEKVTEAIIKDKESIVTQHARGVFIKECIRDELIYFQSSQYHVSRLHQDWAQERVKYSELQADNWKQLHEELESMPIGE